MFIQLSFGGFLVSPLRMKKESMGHVGPYSVGQVGPGKGQVGPGEGEHWTT